MERLPQVETIDERTLVPLVRRVLGSDGATMTEWQRDVVYGGLAPTSGGLHRFHGTARLDGSSVPWSVILKVTVSTDAWVRGADDPTSTWGYWRRELLAYQSGLLDDLPGGVVTPRCPGTAEFADGAWLWLEDISDESGPRWPLDRFGVAARQFGALNGAYLVERPIPDYPWLSRGGLRTWCGRNAGRWAELPRAREDPVLGRYWPGDLAERTAHLIEHREILLGALDRLPQTLCHGDATRANLFARQTDGRDQTVAIDWGFLGVGAVGQEAAQMVAINALLPNAVEFSQVRVLEEIVLDGYLEGLRLAGWRGDPRLVRLGYLVDAVLRLMVLPYAVTIPPEPVRARLEASLGLTFEEACERFVDHRCLMLERADEALELVRVLT